ncbi:MAG: NAD(P)/FAD-dependent oxidoreductase, partial [Candidatus Eremiobacteraeota bacterium]|nr:NAD(P)/FAD-dependent oxidoreductase [Candidatus Eremiobacteraeota bacterium]
GEVAAANLLHGNAKTMDFHGLASCVYTIPAIAKVGLSEREAGETGREFDVHSGEMTTWYSNRRLAERAAAYKLLVEKKTGKILGAHILGANAEEQINVLALAIRREIPAEDVVGALFAYPSGASDIAYML